MGNQFKNAAIITCFKTQLFIFNAVFWVGGFLMFVLALWAEVDLSKYTQFPPDFSDTAFQVMMGISMLMVLVSSVAFSCIIKGHHALLYIYGAFLACIVMMHLGISASVACYKDTFPKGLYEGLIRNLAAYEGTYNDLDFAQEKCCGVANYTDWVKMSPQRVIPISCCIDPNHCVTANYSEVFQKGCYDVITKYFQENVNLLIGLGVTVALFPLSGTVISCGLATYLKKSKHEDIA